MTTKGLKPKDRKLVTTSKGKLTANQWQNTPQQNQFMQNWLETDSPSFGNAYQSALLAGYSDTYSQQISAPAISNKWIQEFTKRLDMQPEHIIAKLQEIALNPENNSRSPVDSQLKALELLSDVHNLTGKSKNHTTNILVQPILGGASAAPLKVKSEIIDT